ncbi:MAG: ABC transporter ATP-binding protein [Gemmatimonadetes bacterium]|nr:ABC transporter ATP-binding protein [Gemmatimonadota bacterium]
MSSVLEARGLHKIYIGGDGSELHVLKGVSLVVQPGESVAITGASGSGKSTLLHLLGGLDWPTAGEVYLDGRPLSQLADTELAEARNRKIGFIFQFHHLLRELSALENIKMPLLIRGTDRREARAQGEAMLRAVGLEERRDQKPPQLSGGELQRVAVARALVSEPVVLLADEPTGNLDNQSAERLHQLLFRLVGERRLALVVVTHNRELAARADRVLRLHDGALQPEVLAEAVHDGL